MKIRKISLLITLLLSVCFVYAQSYIDVEVKNNNLNDEYKCSVQFNQAVTPSGSSSPTTFSVSIGTTYTAHYEFDEYDVDLEAIKCIHSSRQNPIGLIYVSPGPTITVNVLPQLTFWPQTVTYCQFEYWYYYAQGSYEQHKFKIGQ